MQDITRVSILRVFTSVLDADFRLYTQRSKLLVSKPKGSLESTLASLKRSFKNFECKLRDLRLHVLLISLVVSPTIFCYQFLNTSSTDRDRLPSHVTAVVHVNQRNGPAQQQPPAPVPAQPVAPRLIAQVPIRPPDPPPVPHATLRPESGYTRSQVLAMYQTAYNSLYSNVAEYTPWLDSWARDTANSKFTEWYNANARYQQQQRRDREEQRAIQAAAMRVQNRARQEARAAEEAREARRRRTQGKS